MAPVYQLFYHQYNLKQIVHYEEGHVINYAKPVFVFLFFAFVTVRIQEEIIKVKTYKEGDGSSSSSTITPPKGRQIYV